MLFLALEFLRIWVSRFRRYPSGLISYIAKVLPDSETSKCDIFNQEVPVLSYSVYTYNWIQETGAFIAAFSGSYTG
jgi:hypothetical protein